MKLIEGTVFFTLAGALHVAALTLSPGLPGGTGGGGDGGAQSVTLAALPEIAALAQHWDTPPEIALPPVPVAPAPDRSRPERAAPDSPAPAPARPEAPAMSRTAEPAVDARAPAPALPALPQALPGTLARPELPALPAALPTAPLDPAASLTAPAAPPADTLPQVADRPVAPQVPPVRSRLPKLRPEALAAAQVARPAAAPQPARPAQRAAGAGAAPTARKAGTPGAAAGKPGLSNAEAALWAASIRQAISRAFRHPARSNATGVTRLKITVGKNGQAQGHALLSSSGDAALDQAWIQAFQRARLPRAPASLDKASQTFTISLRARMN